MRLLILGMGLSKNEMALPGFSNLLIKKGRKCKSGTCNLALGFGVLCLFKQKPISKIVCITLLFACVSLKVLQAIFFSFNVSVYVTGDLC